MSPDFFRFVMVMLVVYIAGILTTIRLVMG